LTSAPLQSLYAHTVLSLLSFSTLRPLRDFILLPFSLRWRMLDALLAILCSSNLLLSLQGVQQPCEDPSVDSSSNSQNSKSSLLSCACLHTYSMPTWQSIFSQNIQQFCPSAHPMHLLNAHLAELSESLVILFFLKNSQQSSSSVHSLHLLNAHLAELHRTPQRILSATVSLLHSLASKVFNNLEVFTELLIPVLVPQHVFV
jgi:hypothetical protein